MFFVILLAIVLYLFIGVLVGIKDASRNPDSKLYPEEYVVHIILWPMTLAVWLFDKLIEWWVAEHNKKEQ